LGTPLRVKKSGFGRSHFGTWLKNYHCAMLCNNSEVHKSYPRSGGSLNSRRLVFSRSVLRLQRKVIAETSTRILQSGSV